MNKLILATLVAFSASAHAEAVSNDEHSVATASQLDRSQAVYRRIVLGDTGVQVPPAAAATDDRRVPGSYGLYLMHLGMSKADAIAQAERVGEAPGVNVAEVNAEPIRFTSHELYQRTVLGRSDADILSSRNWRSRHQANAERVAR